MSILAYTYAEGVPPSRGTPPFAGKVRERQQRDTEISEGSEGSENIGAKCPGPSELPATRARSAFSDLSDPSVSRCLEGGEAP
jgi:hypothetical protein